VGKREEFSLESMAGARSEGNPGARLLAAARDLFNEQGYQGAGINEIIARSNTSKKSFYHYFPSKRELGEACLLAEEREVQRMMETLMRRYAQDFHGFVRAWGARLKKQAASGRYHGCPFVNAAAHAPTEFRETLEGVAGRWLQILQTYIQTSDLRLDAASARVASKRLLVAYQGAVQMWKLSGSRQYFDIFVETAEIAADV
jgi:AcrR family transcriptional regulator